MVVGGAGLTGLRRGKGPTQKYKEEKVDFLSQHESLPREKEGDECDRDANLKRRLEGWPLCRKRGGQGKKSKVSCCGGRNEKKELIREGKGGNGTRRNKLAGGWRYRRIEGQLSPEYCQRGKVWVALQKQRKEGQGLVYLCLDRKLVV